MPPLLPPQLQMWKCPLLQRPPTQEELIRHNTTRDKVISVMNCIHWEGHDPHHHQQDFKGLPYPETRSTYDERME